MSIDALDWPTCGWAPVYRTDGRPPTSADLVGFTTFLLTRGVYSYRFSFPIVPQWGARDLPSAGLEGAMLIRGEARVIAGDGWLAWLVIDEDPAELPEFWAL